MAFITPQTTGPDGTNRETTVFSTTVSTRFFTGIMGDDTVDMEVSIRGGAFTSDPDLILFEGTSWTIPNPAAFPDGLELVAGLNHIEVQAISTTGTESASGIIDVTLIQEKDINIVANPPTNITMTRLNNSVEITAEAPDSSTFQGMNFYASEYEGGGETGYSRVNLDLVDSGTTEEEIQNITEIEVLSNIATTTGGVPAADPLFVRLMQVQEDQYGVELQEDFSEAIEIAETVTKVRTSVTLDSVREATFLSFDHNRTAGPTSDPVTISNGAFAAVPNSSPLYYVVTALYYDPELLLEVESSYSQEVVGNPVQVTSTLGNFPIVTRQQIAKTTIEAIFRSNPQVRVDPGAPLRDLYIDPFSSEAERIRFIVDFLHRAQSFSTLLQIDDPQSTGESVPVAQSSYKLALKKAFFLNSDSETQAVIDRAFEALASNYGVFRLSGAFARGEATFYTTKRPTTTLPVPLGSLVSGGSRRFRTTSPSSIPLTNLASFYNPVSKRYLVRVPLQATAVGSAGNVGRGQILKIVSALSGLSVINEAAMFGGTNQETNRQLAERAQNALASVDAGTRRGYLQTAAGVPGVIQALVVQAGNSLMQRDLDENYIHRGGKVDVWIQGENLATVTDTFAFTYQIAQNVQFEVVDLTNLIFRAVDPMLSEANPIVEMLDEPTIGFEFRNITTGLVFDLTSVQILSYDTIQLDTSIPQPAVTLTDVVLGDYRRLEGTNYVLSRQPVRSITTVTGTVSGELDPDSYLLVHPKAPLDEGRSALAGDYLDIEGTTDTAGNPIPSGDTITVTDEEHTMIGQYQEFLDSLGANVFTVVVTNTDGSITYKGPNDPSGLPDYTIIDGDQTTAVSLQRTSASTIASGQTVLVSYEHDENFTIEYVTNLVVDTVQDEFANMRHATADVLAKEVVTVPVNITATIILIQGTQTSTADTTIRTNLENLFAALRLGDPVRQSDIIEVIDSSTGVEFVVVPLATLARGEGSTVVRETVSTDQIGDSTFITSLSTSLVAVYLLNDELSAYTTNGGGPVNEFRGVYQSDVDLALQATSLSLVSQSVGRAYIIGSGGAVINGISDDATLTAAGYTTAAARTAARAAITGNRVVVSLAIGDSPANYDYAVTYIVGVDTRATNIDPGDAEVLELGELTFTYDEAG